MIKYDSVHKPVADVFLGPRWPSTPALTSLCFFLLFDYDFWLFFHNLNLYKVRVVLQTSTGESFAPLKNIYNHN